MMPTVIELATHRDERGNLTVAERLPFRIRRVFWLHGIHGDRGRHAHRECEQVLVAVSGEAEVYTEKEGKRRMYRLMDPGIGLYVPPGNCITVKARPEAAVLVLCSQPYDAEDVVPCAS